LGSAQVHGELLKLGFQISERSVARYLSLMDLRSTKIHENPLEATLISWNGRENGEVDAAVGKSRPIICLTRSMHSYR
jgi:hypothetical protein